MKKLKIEEVNEPAQAIELGFKADLFHSKACLFNHVLYRITAKMALYLVGDSKTENLPKPRESPYSQLSGYLFPVLVFHSSSASLVESFTENPQLLHPPCLKALAYFMPIGAHIDLFFSNNFCLCWQHHTISTYFYISYYLMI